MATFTVVLDSEPTADVTIGLSSSDLTEGTVLPTSLVFTAANWNTTQMVSVTGVDDAAVDGSVSYTILTAAATSADTLYNGLNAADVAVTNTDNDTPCITVSAISGHTSEAGGMATFSVVLDSQPTADVTIALSSSDTTEGTLGVSSLVFTVANWNMPQVVTVTGVDDAIDDGDVSYSIVTAAATSADAFYDGLAAADVSVSNTDNDTVGITVSAISGDTSEAGGMATFTVVLNTQPTADVTIGLSSSDLTEGTVLPTSLVFTTANWNMTQMVSVTGVDDAAVDGSVSYTILTAAATSADTLYNGLDAADVAVTNSDNDVQSQTTSFWDGVPDGGGVSTNANWLTATNWVGDRVPSPGDNLIFPAGPSVVNTVNDFPAGTGFNSIVIPGSGYTLGTLNGNEITLQAGINASGSNNTLSLPITLSAPQMIAGYGGLSLNGTLDQSGHALTFGGTGTTVNGELTGAGGVVIQGSGVVFAGANSYSGSTTISGQLSIRNSLALGAADGTDATGTTLSGGTLTLDGALTVGGELLTANGGSLSSTGNSDWGGNVVVNGDPIGPPILSCHGYDLHDQWGHQR